MQITNHAELAAYLGAAHNTEESISRAVYKGTTCGAWAALEEAIPVGRMVAATWHFHIADSPLGLELIEVRKTDDEDWTDPEDAPPEVLDCLCGHEYREGRCILTDESTIQFIEANRWSPDEPYYEVQDVSWYVGGYAPGVSFGSIVEGVEMTTETLTVTYPCTGEDITKALGEIEAQAQEIWDQTHGCPECYDGKETVNIWEWASENGDDLGARVIDPNCTECKGQGVAI